MKKIVKLSLILSLLCLTSCITRYIKKDPSYYEAFDSYYVSKHSNDLVFIGKNYHYVFKDKLGYISEFTKEEWKSKLVISNINLSVNKDNIVTGYVRLEILKPTTDLTKQEIVLLKKYGFEENNKYILNRKIDLNGVRYQPRLNSSQKGKNYFSKPYKAKIMYNLSKHEKVRKATLTPVAFVADGAIILAGGVWIPLIIIALTAN